MKEERLLVDISPTILFGLATVVFGIGWLQTGRTIYLLAVVIVGMATAYTLYRLRTLYLE